MSGLSVRVRHRRRGVRAEFDLRDGQVLAVVGPNGAGKSTLLATIAGLLRPDEGRVRLGDTVLTDTAAGVFVPPHARGVGLLAQDALLFPHLTVLSSVAYGPRRAGRRRAEAFRVARHWLAAVDAGHLADRRPGQLSGGQAQRVAIARALAADPGVLLLDEPLAALDVTAAPPIRRLLRAILRGRTAVIVTHDLLDALTVADTVVVMEHGAVVEHGPARSVLTEPRSDFAAKLAGLNLIRGTCAEAGLLRTPSGEELRGTGDVEPGAPAVALFRPEAVSIRLEAPASRRNVIPAVIADLDVTGGTVHLRTAEGPEGRPGVVADVPVSGAMLDLVPGQRVHLVVDAAEVRLRDALSRR